MSGQSPPTTSAHPQSISLQRNPYDSRVYAKHRIAPRATDCISDDAQNCDTLRDSRRVAAWLDQWRYVWSCDGPKECEVRISGQNEPVGGLGVQIWARKGNPCSEGVIAFRGTMQGNRGDWESNFHWILRAFPVYDQYDQVRDHIGDFVAHIERDKCYRAGSTQITAVGHSLGGGLAQLAAYSDPNIRRVYAFDPSMVTGYYSVDPRNRDENVKVCGWSASTNTARSSPTPDMSCGNLFPFLPAIRGS
jgi:hypothetical protein